MSNETIHSKTQKRWAPELRFKEFEEKWLKIRLLDEVKIRHGQVDPKLEEFADLPLIAPNHIESGTGRVIAMETAAEQNAISGKFLFDPNIVVYSKIRPYLKKAFVTTCRGLCSADMYPLVPTDRVESRFLIHIILGDRFTKFANSVSARTGMPKINREELGEYFTYLPSLPEQQKIASFLSAVDKKIQQLTKKKEFLEQYKKGVMQQLFSGQLCFKEENGNNYPDWEEKRLGEYLIHKSIRNKDLKVDLVLSVSNKKGFISQNEQFDGHEVASKDLSNYKIVDKDDVAYNPSRINVGSIARLIDFEKGIVSPMYVIFSLKDDLNKIFFENLYKTHRFKHLIKVGCSGSVRDSLNFDDLCDFSFKFPSIEEQQKIATYLSSIYSKIDSVNNCITQTQTFKKGLLQQMFV